MSFPRYPKYKDSGVEWLGEVPEHWLPFRYKNIFREKDRTLGHFLPPGAISFGNVVLKDGDSMNEATKATYQEVLTGEFLINPINLNYDLKSLRTALSKIDTCVSPAYIVLKLFAHASPQYLKYQLFLFDVRHMKTLGAGVRQTISFADIGQCFSILPPFEEQTAIATFLDRETAKIDALVAEQQRLMDLLKEKRQAVISHTVTRGLNPAAPLKESGIEWLGQVPDHWRVIPLKYLVTESVAGPYGASLTKAMYSDSGYRVYGQQQAITNDFTLGDYYITEEKYEEMRRYTVFPGDLLISVMGTIGKVAIVPDDVEPGIINPRLVRYRCGDKIAPQFMRTLLLTAQYQELLKLESNGSTMDGLNMRIIGDIPVVVPPLAEQLAILSHLHPEIIKFETLTAESQRAIELLQERRTALISAAVTGQIKVS